MSEFGFWAGGGIWMFVVYNSNNAFYVVRILYLVFFRVLSSGQAAPNNSARAVSFVITYLKVCMELETMGLILIYLKKWLIT